MKKNHNKKIITTVITTLSLSAMSSFASVILTVSSDGAAGVNITASGTLDLDDIQAIGTFHSDVGSSSFVIVSPTGYGTFGSTASDSYELGVNATIAPLQTLGAFAFYSIVDAGNGNTFRVSNSGDPVENLIAFGGSDFLDNDAADSPASIFTYNFVWNDSDGSLSDYTDGHVLFDSNGADAGGQTIIFAVVPEPSSSALLGLAAVGFLLRRRRA